MACCVVIGRMAVATRKIGLWSGIGLTLADMVGTGVLTTAGFMALDLTPRQILLDWLLGGVIALAGATAYAALARQVPRSGGEYRYLSELFHPALGYLAGWTSLMVGFSVPVALAALAGGAFAQTVLGAVDARLTAAILRQIGDVCPTARVVAVVRNALPPAQVEFTTPLPRPRPATMG